jgi:outer membrane protein
MNSRSRPQPSVQAALTLESFPMRSIPFLPTLLGVALLLAVSAGGMGAQTGLKIGYINSAAIYEEAPGAQAAQTEFEREMTTYRQEVQRLGEELQTMIASYEQQQMTLSAEARQAREAAIREKDGAYRQRVSQLENEAGRRQQELVEPIMRQINDVIEALRREGNYSLIFDVGPGSNIIAADPALDLTNEVIRRLRAEDR